MAQKKIERTKELERRRHRRAERLKERIREAKKAAKKQFLMGWGFAPVIIMSGAMPDSRAVCSFSVNAIKRFPVGKHFCV